MTAPRTTRRIEGVPLPCPNCGAIVQEIGYLAIEAEADRSLLLDAALRRLVRIDHMSHQEVVDATPPDDFDPETWWLRQYNAAWDNARAALAATDVRGALAEALRDDPPHPWATPEEAADAILAALAAKGVEG